MKINIVLPYEQAEKYVNLWAFEEKEINFEKENERAQRCTVSFGATELVKYLEKMCFSAVITSKKKENHINITLKCGEKEKTDCSFKLIPEKDGFCIFANSRTGVLYGCYEFLKIQGVRWYAPGENYEFVPKNLKALKIPEKEESFSPDMSLGRGFDFEGILKESESLFLWMARNRLNIASYRVHTDALMQKLGMTYKVGGHIFEKMLNPNNISANGKIFWEAHNDWYGTPDTGEKTKENALGVQFCVSNEELTDYLSKKLNDKLNNEWKNASRVDIWGFDTWGKTCNCEKCRKLGNGTDKALYFMSNLRKRINKSRLKRKIELVMCAYDGTDTLQPPESDIPKNLKENGDLIVFYPISRCYRHNFNDKACEINKHFCEALEKWIKKDNVPNIVIGEYYNVSKLEDLPLVFTKRIENDIKYYIDLGIKGITYMHVPLINHSVRAINHLLYAEISQNRNADVESLINEYFKNMYGKYENEMKEVYKLLEEGWENCQKLRSWGDKSVLSQLLCEKSDRESLDLENHFKNEDELALSCKTSVEKLQKALFISKNVYKDIKENTFVQCTNLRPVNPEQGKTLLPKSEFVRISEDIRFIKYGLDVMKLTGAVIDYHRKMINNESTDKVWEEIELLYDKLNEYYFPVTLDNNKTEIYCRDALTRSQLRPIADRYRMKRKEKI